MHSREDWRLDLCHRFHAAQWRDLERSLQQTDNIAAMGEGMVFHENGTLTLSSQTIRQYFYNKTPEPLVQMACQRIAPEPAASAVTPIHVTAERFGTVPRAYIECAQDQGLTLNVQRAMQEALPVAFTDRLEADHSPSSRHRQSW